MNMLNHVSNQSVPSPCKGWGDNRVTSFKFWYKTFSVWFEVRSAALLLRTNCSYGGGYPDFFPLLPKFLLVAQNKSEERSFGRQPIFNIEHYVKFMLCKSFLHHVLTPYIWTLWVHTGPYVCTNEFYQGETNFKNIKF